MRYPYVVVAALVNLAEMPLGRAGSGRGGGRRRAGRQPNGRPLLRGPAARRSNTRFRRRMLREQDRG